MKKLLFLGLVFGAVTFASCKKSGSCDCNGTEGQTYTSDNSNYEAIKSSCKLTPSCKWVSD